MPRLAACLTLLLTASLPALAQSPASCPWLTLGTASSLLGVSAAVRVQLAEDGSGSCRFQPQTETDSAPTQSLIVTVTTHPGTVCDSHATPLRGIGNQAEECVLAASRSQDAASGVTRIAGKVRDHWFVLDASGLPRSSLRNPPPRWPDEAARPTQLELAAEQVADNLY